MDYSFCNASTLSVLAVTIERYLSIKHVFFHRNHLTQDRLKNVIYFIWIVSFTVWSSFVFAYPTIHGEWTVPDDACYVQFIYENPTVTISTAFIIFFGPIIVMAVIYVVLPFAILKMYKKA